jgi:hypothetical protein
MNNRYFASLLHRYLGSLLDFKLKELQQLSE